MLYFMIAICFISPTVTLNFSWKAPQGNCTFYIKALIKVLKHCQPMGCPGSLATKMRWVHLHPPQATKVCLIGKWRLKWLSEHWKCVLRRLDFSKLPRGEYPQTPLDPCTSSTCTHPCKVLSEFLCTVHTLPRLLNLIEHTRYWHSPKLPRPCCGNKKHVSTLLLVCSSSSVWSFRTGWDCGTKITQINVHLPI